MNNSVPVWPAEAMLYILARTKKKKAMLLAARFCPIIWPLPSIASSAHCLPLDLGFRIVFRDSLSPLEIWPREFFPESDRPALEPFPGA